jgi:hypothetical protein
MAGLRLPAGAGICLTTPPSPIQTYVVSMSPVTEDYFTCGRNVQVVTNLHLVSRYRIFRRLHQRHLHTPYLRGALLRHRGKFTTTSRVSKLYVSPLINSNFDGIFRHVSRLYPVGDTSYFVLHKRFHNKSLAQE